MAQRFEDRVVVITGGGAGIGAATARRFAIDGASVVISDLSGKRAEKVASEISCEGGAVAWIKADAAQPDGVQAAIQLAVNKYGRLDIMCNNVGTSEIARLEEISLESWNRVIAITLTSTFLGMKYCIPIMRKQGKGVIVNTASVSGIAGDYGMASYNAAKAGVINLTRTAALENAKYNIRVNCICPGTIRTRVAEVLGKDKAEEFLRIQAEAHPVGRIGEPDEIASTVLFLASDEASFITGAAVVVDGGLTAHTGSPNMLTR